MTLGTFICKKVTNLSPFLTMYTGPKGLFSIQNLAWYIIPGFEIHIWFRRDSGVNLKGRISSIPE